MRIRVIIIGLLAVLGFTSACNLEEEPTPVQPAEKGAAVKGNGGKKKATRIKLAAVRTAHKPGPLDTGGAFSCVRVTVVNQSAKNLEVNPMYFSLVDTGGTKHEIDITAAAGNGQIDTTTLAPHEKAKGVVCGAGKFVPKIVAMTNPLFSEAARAEVAG
ncbi:DUF4352 domain-containing protein [Spirillospora sp. NBC_01491]|uniref:DUF4352 domain-containing protein n=1 Tax=Spirillospora sp. NBC_01491 TaxID=2976007 RepID=UPI002E32C6CB|nr:DUF4352 domain-containing protein [Spirillospora sp. NBC_01491]